MCKMTTAKKAAPRPTAPKPRPKPRAVEPLLIACDFCDQEFPVPGGRLAAGVACPDCCPPDRPVVVTPAADPPKCPECGDFRVWQYHGGEFAAACPYCLRYDVSGPTDGPAVVRTLYEDYTRRSARGVAARLAGLLYAAERAAADFVAAHGRGAGRIDFAGDVPPAAVRDVAWVREVVDHLLRETWDTISSNPNIPDDEPAVIINRGDV